MSLKISHEVPLQLLEQSTAFNDYDYALVHLFDKYPEYKQFFRDSISMGREVLLDNSAFELGGSVCEEKLMQGIKDINPTYVVLPDVIGKYDETIERSTKFWDQLKYRSDVRPEPIAVIQGTTLEQYIRCHEYFTHVLKIDYIAIPLYVKCFATPANTSAMKYSLSRYRLIAELLERNVINRYSKYHLLGANDPIEFQWYRNPAFKFITSADTSCPIITGMFGERLSPIGREKRSEKLADNMEMMLTAEQIRLIYNNIEIYHKNYAEGIGE